MFFWMTLGGCVLIASLVLSNWLAFYALRDTERKHKIALEAVREQELRRQAEASAKAAAMEPRFGE